MTTDTTTSTATADSTGATGGDNTVNWWEIQIPDLAAAQAFYGGVFGWTFTAYGDTYALVHAPDGSMIGGLDQVQGDPAGRHVRIYVRVADLERTLAAITEAGGTVEQDRKLISEDYGWFATVVDPSGLRIGLTTGNAPTA